MAVGGIASLCWVAFKVGALSYGGGFVIVPLMQHDAVVTYHWMSGGQFLKRSLSVRSLRDRWCKPLPWSATQPEGWEGDSWPH